MAGNTKKQNPIYRNYLKKSCDMLTERDMFEVTCAIAGIRTPQKLFDRFGSFASLLAEPGEYLADTTPGDAGEKLAAILKLVRDCTWAVGTDSYKISEAEEKLKELEEEMKMSAHLRATSEFLRSVSPEHINELCISLAQKSYDPERETIWASYLDRKNRIIEECLIGAGNYGTSSLNLRTLIKPAFKNNASALIIAHSHPDGSLEPSQSDIATTDRISLICDSLGINLIDHIIVIPGKYRSIMYPEKKTVSFSGGYSDFETPRYTADSQKKQSIQKYNSDDCRVFAEISEKDILQPTTNENSKSNIGNELISDFLNKSDTPAETSSAISASLNSAVPDSFTADYNPTSDEGNLAWEGNDRIEAINEYAKRCIDDFDVSSSGVKRSSLQREADKAYSRLTDSEICDENTIFEVIEHLKTESENENTNCN